MSSKAAGKKSGRSDARSGIFAASLEYSFPLILCEVLFILIEPYHKGLSLSLLMPEYGHRVPQCIISAAYYVLYIFILRETASHIFDIKQSEHDVSETAKMLLYSFILRAVLDIPALFSLEFTDSPYLSSFLCIVSEMAFVMIFVTEYIRKSNAGAVSFKDSLKVFAVFLAAAFLCFLFAAVRFERFEAKYARGEIYFSFLRNTLFMLELWSLILMSLWHIFFIHMLCVRSGRFPAKRRRGEAGKYERFRIRNVLLIRFEVILGVTAAAAILKLLIYPAGSLLAFPRIMSTDSSDKFCETHQTDLKLYRSDGTFEFSREEDYLVYAKSFCSIAKDGKRLLTFSDDTVDTMNSSAHHWYDSRFHYIVNEDGQTMTEESFFMNFGNNVICFFDRGELRALRFEDIPKCDESGRLTEILESNIEKLRWEYFEYGFEYLLRNDPDFIKPYIEKFRTNDFDSGEEIVLMYVEPKYRMELAEKITDEFVG